MTRDEAIALIKQHHIGSRWQDDWIDRFVALGMLKLDEPRSVENKALWALVNRCRMSNSHGGDCVSFSKSEADRVIDLLNIAGLKIVEK